MSSTGYNYAGPDDMEGRLSFWLSMDEWGISEAIQIFAGIDPEWSRQSRSKEAFSFEAVIQISGLQTPALDEQGYPMCSCHDDDCTYCGDVKTTLLALSRKCKEIANLFGDRYQHRTFASPKEWIERALSRNVEIPWFKWAKKHRLLPYGLVFPIKQTKTADAQSVSGTERTTLLAIVAALCNCSDIKYQKRGAPQRLMKMTDDIGAHVDDGTIRTALKRITFPVDNIPLATKERNSLLTIIAALCNDSGIKHQEQGAARVIMEILDEAGTHFDEDIILTVLKQIPESLITRTK
jgi:hypothetical protein